MSVDEAIQRDLIELLVEMIIPRGGLVAQIQVFG